MAVAIKTLFVDPSSSSLDGRNEFLDEVEVMRILSNHPNIVTFHGTNSFSSSPTSSSSSNNNMFMVMELCECSLYSLIHEEVGEGGGGLEVDEKYIAMVSFSIHLSISSLFIGFIDRLLQSPISHALPQHGS